MKKQPKILIVEDEVGAQESYRMILKEDYELSVADTAEKGFNLFRKELFDLLLLDVHLPDRTGLSLLKDLRNLDGEVPVIFVTATKEIENAVEAMKLGAHDYLTKPFNSEELRVVVHKALKSKWLQEEVRQLRGEVKRAYGFENIVGKGPKMEEVYAQISKFLDNSSTVLITGKSGTGKELVARAIHYNGQRKEGPFVALHTAAISENLLESELFGHEKGAFTDAVKAKKGMFEMAHHGTLFLDEIGEMDLSTQVKLLRVLQEREFRRVGGTENIAVDTRVLVASNKDLWQEVQAGRFREDLYYRVAVIPLHLPLLRERKEDIPLLIHHFIQKLKETITSPVERFSQEAINVLSAYNWPGNIRELQNIVERLLVTSVDKEISAKQIPTYIQQSKPLSQNAEDPSLGSSSASLSGTHLSLEERVEQFEKELIEQALRATNYIQTNAAKLLKTTRRIIKYKMDRFRIASPK